MYILLHVVLMKFFQQIEMGTLIVNSVPHTREECLVLKENNIVEGMNVDIMISFHTKEDVVLVLMVLNQMVVNKFALIQMLVFNQVELSQFVIVLKSSIILRIHVNVAHLTRELKTVILVVHLIIALNLIRLSLMLEVVLLAYKVLNPQQIKENVSKLL